MSYYLFVFVCVVSLCVCSQVSRNIAGTRLSSIGGFLFFASLLVSSQRKSLVISFADV
jgi:hypothetical protein